MKSNDAIEKKNVHRNPFWFLINQIIESCKSDDTACV